MEREQRFVTLVQTLLLLRAQRGHWHTPMTSQMLGEDEVMNCLDDAYYFAGTNPKMMAMELNKLATSYVNNWLGNTRGWKRNTDGG